MEEIRQQPEHIRHIFMWLCVAVTFSVVGFVWFRSTSRQFVALMHPEVAQERALAEKEKPLRQTQVGQLSPFATILDSWRNLQANISELFAGSKSNLEIKSNNTAGKINLPPQTLPITE